MTQSAGISLFSLAASSWRAIVSRSARAGTVRRLIPALLLFAVTLAITPLAAAQTDADGDGLFDDDETAVYGTDPGVAESDGDGSSDGEEVHLGTDPLSPPSR